MKRLRASWDIQSEMKKALLLSAVKKEIKWLMEDSGLQQEVCSTQPIVDTAEDEFYMWVNARKPPRMRVEVPAWPVLTNTITSLRPPHDDTFSEDLDEQFSYTHWMEN